jgi:putative transposase
MSLVADVGPRLGIAPACRALGVSRSSFYRWGQPKASVVRRPPPRALSEQERTQVLQVLREPRFVDQAPAEVHATLLDEERYLCSERTMYRILAENREVRERRNQLRHPQYSAPQLLATRPNEIWSWDITKLLGPAKWTYFYLYVILDIFSRFVVGWMVAPRELASLAQRLIAATCYRQGIQPGQLTIHADRGSSMTSKTVALLLADLGVTKTHSRPHVSNDNPYSESHFKTVKYRPGFPERFGCIQGARSVCGDLFRWYNHEHHHSGLGMLTPYDVHHGLAQEKLARRGEVLAHAYAAHPERFPHGAPQPADVPKEVWINKPPQKAAEGCILTKTGNSGQIDARGCPRIDDLEVGIGRATPESPTRDLSEVIL